MSYPLVPSYRIIGQEKIREDKSKEGPWMVAPIYGYGYRFSVDGFWSKSNYSNL